MPSIAGAEVASGMGMFFIVVGFVVIVLWTRVLPKVDRALARRSPSDSVRRSEAWQRFQSMNNKQAVVFGAFLILLGVILVINR